MYIRIYAALYVTLAAVGATGLFAQSANASVSATVQQPITVTKTADLQFEDVFPGVNKTVTVTDAKAASFTIQGQATASISMTFTLPSTLSDGGGNSLTISNWTGIYNTSASPSSGTTFTPSPSAINPNLSGAGALYVYVGASVEPTTTQTAGTYTGTVTLTVTY